MRRHRRTLTSPVLAAALVGLSLLAAACDKGTTPPAEGTGAAVEPSAGQAATPEAPATTAQAEPQGTGHLVLWHSYRQQEEASLNQVLELYHRTHPGMHVEALAIPFDAYPDRITAAIPRGRGPDLFIYAHDRVGDWADEGLIEPINFWTDDELLSQFFDITVQALVYQRGLYGLPLVYKSVVLFYNPNMVTTPPTTTDEMIALASQLTNTEGEGQYGLVYLNTSLYFHAPWLHGFGGRVFDDNGQLTIDTPEAAASVAFAASLHRQYHLLPENVQSHSVTSLFNAGRAAMVISGPWFWSELTENAPWAVAPLPVINATGQQATPFLGSEAVMISSRSANKPLAFEFARWLATDLEAARIRMEVGHQPVALQAAYADMEQVHPAIRVFHDQMLHSIPMPNIPMMRRVWGHMDTALFNAIKNGADPAEVLRTARTRIESEGP
ncbi:MAG: extracellular solute-binding protein [Bradymonadales bacterium]|nr:extracellular solute-binding protein [Bradymonadales bacterium]